MRTRVTIALLAISALACLLPLSACNSEDEPASESPSTGGCADPLRTLCTAYADFDLWCGKTTTSERNADLSACLADPETSVIPFNCAYVEGVSSCLANLACGNSDDGCVYEGFMAAAPDGWDVPTMRSCMNGTITDEATCDAAVGGDTRACLDRLVECIGGPYEGATDPPYADDNCFTLAALTPEAASTAAKCLTLDCDQIGTCMRTAGTFSY